MNLSWDERWKQKAQQGTTAADPWLLKHQDLLTGGVALDLACGRGRHSLLLAEMSYTVFALDVSQTALDLLQNAATEKKLAINPLRHDLERGLPLLTNPPDLILCFYYLQRNLFPAIKQQLEPGGLFIARSFCHLSPQSETSEIIYAPQELTGLFADWEILDYEEGVEHSERGGTLAGIVARKPRK